MGYLQLKPTTLAHNRALLALLSLEPCQSTITVKKSELCSVWTDSQSSRASIIKACMDLPRMKFRDKRNGGRSFALVESVEVSMFEVEFVLNLAVDIVSLWRELKDLLIDAVNGVCTWVGVKSRYTLPLFLAQVTAGKDYFTLEELRDVTSCHYTYSMDRSFVRQVMSAHAKDLLCMNMVPWKPDTSLLPGAKSRFRVVGYHT